VEPQLKDCAPATTGGLSPSGRSDLTYRWDRIRGTSQGLLETCWNVFALLIAIRVFAADESLKQFIPVGKGIGLLLSPLALAVASRFHSSVATILAVLWAGISVGTAMMIVAPGIGLFVVGVILAQLCATGGVPLLTHLYSRNYRSHERGARLSTTFLLGSLAGVVYGYLGGELLDWEEAAWPLVFGVALVAAVIGAFAVARFPSEPATELSARNPFRSLALAWEDRLFGVILFAWMLMGLGNLMQIPLRVEYLANPRFGINASNAEASAILVSTVLGFRLLSTKVWGWLFDRVNVMTVRVGLNLVFMASIASFFFTESLWLMAAGSALMGIAFGGGGIMWNLYVTKIAPPAKVAGYMSAHGFLTGVRMTAAPFLGYAVMEISHPSAAAYLSMVLIAISTLTFLPLRPLIARRAHLDS
jgi:MFS family permease